jgi:hypothetical protein
MNDPSRNFAVPWEAQSAPIEPRSLPTHPALRPLPPMRLSRAARAALFGLRILLGLITGMAIFTFLHGNQL